MADITYCNCKECCVTKCERHQSKIFKASLNGVGYVSVANYSDNCKNFKSRRNNKK